MGQKSAQRAQKSLNKDQVSFKLLMESTILSSKLLMESTILSFKLLMESTILSFELLMESTILSSELLMESSHFEFQPPTYWSTDLLSVSSTDLLTYWVTHDFWLVLQEQIGIFYADLVSWHWMLYFGVRMVHKQWTTLHFRSYDLVWACHNLPWDYTRVNYI